MICPRCTAHTVPLDDGRPFCPACLWEGQAIGRPPGRSTDEEAESPSIEERVQIWIDEMDRRDRSG